MPFVCDLCGKEFSTNQRLQSHYDKKVCGDPDNMPDPTPTPTPDPTPTPQPPKPGLDLFSGQSSAGSGDNYYCGNCDHSQKNKFKYCPACGAENEF